MILTSHEVLGAAAIIIFIIAYIFYVRGIFRSEFRPHFFSWLIWFVTLGVTVVAQIIEGAGPGAWTNALWVIATLIVLFYAVWRGEKKFTRGDWISLLIAFSAIPIWYATHIPAYAAMISTSMDCIGFYPTFRKSYLHPYQEGIAAYALFGLQYVFSFFALDHITIATAISPVAMVFMNATFVAFLLWRRYKVKT